MKKNHPWSVEIFKRKASKAGRRKKKRRAIRSKGYEKLLKFWLSQDFKIIDVSDFGLYKFLRDVGFISSHTAIVNGNLVLPKKFTLADDSEEALLFLSSFFKSVYTRFDGEITIDFFSKCKEVDQAALFVLNTMRLDLKEFFDALDTKLQIRKRNLSYKCIISTEEDVNKLLFMNRLIPETQISNVGEKMHPVNTLGIFKVAKPKKHYIENNSGPLTTKLVRYINDCLVLNNYQLTAEGVNAFEGLVSEILINAEEHSPFNTYYVTCNLMKEKNSEGTHISELSLSFMNFGYSIFDGFEISKEENQSTYQLMDDLFSTVKSSLFFPFTKENLFTLYALQDGISRLKYKDESRGTGTMKFINSFFLFGDYKDKLKGYDPKLNILSGKTHLTCDTKYIPFSKSDRFYLSLNSENDLAKSPDPSNLRNLKKVFPGTLLTVDLYINQRHLDEKFK